MMSPNRSTSARENSAQAHVVLKNDDLLTKILIRLPIYSSLYNRIKTTAKNSHFPYYRLESRKSAIHISFNLGSAEEVDNLRILQSCHGLLLCSGSASCACDYVYNPCTNLFKRHPQPENSHDDSRYYKGIVLRMAFDPRKSLDYKVVQVVGRINFDLKIQNDAFHWLETENRQLTLYKLNIQDHDHPIITTIQIPHGLHRGRNFLQSFGGSDNPMLVLIDIPCILHPEGRLFELHGCLLLVCKDDIRSREFTIYKMMKGCSVWTVRYLVNTNDL
ncbi:hypothetical protein Tco_0578860 [Tanacetum coccineum]